ncbi:Gp138 family membrane-puncturing spike protein, partial [Leptospira santarosai]
ILDAITSLTVPCTAPGSPSEVPTNSAVFTSIKARLSSILSSNMRNN